MQIALDNTDLNMLQYLGTYAILQTMEGKLVSNTSKLTETVNA